MQIKLKEITVRELTNGYQDNEENGVVGYGGKLDIRPPYQREFIYKDKQRDAVINTITKNFPLNVMYWAVREDGNFEVIDGQQRTISISQFADGDFAFQNRYFHNLQKDEQAKILDYKLMVYLCSGTDSEKLEWFRTINIAGEKLTDQELRNAVYAGSWVSDAKRYFSKNNCPAYNMGSDYLSGAPIRQEYLETTIEWISNSSIENYMAEHQNNPNANELWLYFQSVINWVKAVFPKYRNEMKGIEWGFLYNEFKDKNPDSKKLEKEITKLMQDQDVTNKKGIYWYVLNRKEKHLNIRAFDDNQKREAYERQKGICKVCRKHFKIEEMEADHIKPWHEGGKTSADNCQMLCKEDNRRKSGK
ncbi:HNH endonuclease family protein [Pedobacter sp.]